MQQLSGQISSRDKFVWTTLSDFSKMVDIGAGLTAPGLGDRDMKRTLRALFMAATFCTPGIALAQSQTGIDDESGIKVLS